MRMWTEDGGESQRRPVAGRIRIERKRHILCESKQTSTWVTLHVHSPAFYARRLQISIVKSAHLPNVGCCEGGLSMATLERLEPYVGKPTSTILMSLGSGN
jgi:hypothetical protein